MTTLKTRQIIASIPVFFVILSLILFSVPVNAATIKIDNDRFTQYEIEGQSTPKLDQDQNYSAVINEFNVSKTRHIFAQLHTQSISTEDEIQYFNHFIIANLGTKDIIIKNKDIINNDKIIESKIDFPILQDLPQEEVKWISDQVCNLNNILNNVFQKSTLLSNCISYSDSDKDVVIKPGQFFLKVYLNSVKVNPTAFFPVEINAARNLSKNDLVKTSVSIKVSGIGNPIVLKSLLSIGNKYDNFAPNNSNKWTESTSEYEYNGKKWLYSTNGIVTPLSLLSSIYWTNQ